MLKKLKLKNSEKKTVGKLLYTGVDDDILDLPPKATATKANLNK